MPKITADQPAGIDYTADDQLWAVATGVTVGPVTSTFASSVYIDFGTTGGTDAVTMSGADGRVENRVGASIAGTVDGVLIETSSGGAVVNKGDISGDSNAGIEFGAGAGTAKVLNSGDISSTSGAGIAAHDGSLTVNNTGTIDGSTHGILLDTSATLLTLYDSASGEIDGDVDVLAGAAHIINKGEMGDVTTGAGADTIRNTGIMETVHLGDGADSYRGGPGSSALVFGDAGDDTLSAGSGSDTLNGGDGADILVAHGHATLDGGAGDDALFAAQHTHFVFDSVADADGDTIHDFHTHNQDVFDLSAIDADTNTAGDQAFTFIGRHNFHHVAGELRFDGHAIYGDVNGDGVADFVISFSEHHGKLIPSEFIF